MPNNIQSKTLTQQKSFPAIHRGEIIKVPCPFLRTAHDDYAASDPEASLAPQKVLSWRPGVIWDGDGYYETWATAHGMGFVVYKIIDTHKLPRPYQARVFYIRTWIDPDGRAFGKKDLKITTPQALKYKISKWENRIYDVEIVELSDADRKKLLEAA